MIALKNLSYRVENRPLFEHFDLQVAPKERLVILGPSGAGKSTLLRLIAGFVLPQSGEIVLDGQTVSQGNKMLVEPHQRGVGMLFQDLALWPHLDVGGNIAFGLKIQKIQWEVRQQKVEKMLAMVGLQGYETRKVDTLSGGEQQRVALARALALSPKIMLMDEPLSSLDAERNKALRKEIIRLQEEMGFTLVYVTHSQEEANEIGTRELLLGQ